MCFGPVASFTASGVLASIGTVVVKNIRSKKEIVFSVFPILFALQQFIEGCLWLAIRNNKPDILIDRLAFIYLVFAYSLWPVLCPISVYAIEYDKNRKRILSFLILLGMATSYYLFYCIIKNPTHAAALSCQIRYDASVAAPRQFTGVYMIVIILPYFISSHRSILVFGIPNLIFCVIAYVFYNVTFISVWCFFAAILSVSLYVFLRRLHHQPLFSIPITR